MNSRYQMADPVCWVLRILRWGGLAVANEMKTSSSMLQHLAKNMKTRQNQSVKTNNHDPNMCNHCKSVKFTRKTTLTNGQIHSCRAQRRQFAAGHPGRRGGVALVLALLDVCLISFKTSKNMLIFFFFLIYNNLSNLWMLFGDVDTLVVHGLSSVCCQWRSLRQQTTFRFAKHPQTCHWFTAKHGKTIKQGNHAVIVTFRR